jgi:hypothetical protein
MVGTFGGALEARQIDASGGRLTADVTGEVETDDKVLVIRRIHVAMRLAAPEDARETVERVHGFYAMRCPLYRTLHNAIALSSFFRAGRRTQELISSPQSPRRAQRSEFLPYLYLCDLRTRRSARRPDRRARDILKSELAGDSMAAAQSSQSRLSRKPCCLPLVSR